jgi:hypothetical protein
LEESKRTVDENTRVLQLVQNHLTSGRLHQKQQPFEEMKINPEPGNISFIEQPSSISPHNFSLNSTSTVSICGFGFASGSLYRFIFCLLFSVLVWRNLTSSPTFLSSSRLSKSSQTFFENKQCYSTSLTNASGSSISGSTLVC